MMFAESQVVLFLQNCTSFSKYKPESVSLEDLLLEKSTREEHISSGKCSSTNAIYLALKPKLLPKWQLIAATRVNLSEIWVFQAYVVRSVFISFVWAKAWGEYVQVFGALSAHKCNLGVTRPRIGPSTVPQKLSHKMISRNFSIFVKLCLSPVTVLILSFSNKSPRSFGFKLLCEWMIQ